MEVGFWYSEILGIPMLVFISGIVVLLAVLGAYVTKKWIEYLEKNTLEIPATVRVKTMKQFGPKRGPNGVDYTITFVKENGDRVEFDVKEKHFAVLDSDDKGILRYRGKKFVGFIHQAQS